MREDTYSISQTPQVWIDHVASEKYGYLRLTWDAVEDLFPSGVLDAMFGAYSQLVRQLADDEEIWQEIDPVSVPAEQVDRWNEVNATEMELPRTDLLHGAFVDRVAEQPTATAVIAAGRTLTYDELYREALRVGHRLRQLGARPNELVAVVMEKGWEQVVGVMGIEFSEEPTCRSIRAYRQSASAICSVMARWSWSSLRLESTKVSSGPPT